MKNMSTTQNIGGKILNPPNLLGWENFEIKKFIETEFGVPVAVNNDANVAGYGEAKVGSGKDSESVYYITLSTGIGGGYIYKGALEGQCSGINISRIDTEKLNKHISTKEVFEQAQLKNPYCKEIINNWVINISKAIANIIVIVDPEVIVLGGSIILHNITYLKDIVSQVKKMIFETVNVNIKLAEIGDDAGLIGSSILATSLINE
ncbi:ROK family protein [Clostridioides sp. ES-S-0108-01]|uniref:ROK family protein n=1 Tax=Clostridioides sp. ES-S-0108-01 TaxID=2770773 RepID=UPI001D0CBC99|nr:ROK family protein [Clostridioides sp. ES-S-0108-01]UDN50230.1 ROK family protein [Clostridioides sp. ES-S-0107-01]